ncbi:hypothetical protein GCM10009851_22310 [Herbiconiux moechotypicola]|uniref:DUF559 domain-containing protein n=2 Tax=Herbiconiux moechotypicola TaxID=637393 RepID=A0ABN3DMU2_9MICO
MHVSSCDGNNRPRLGGVRGHELSDRAIRVVSRHGLRVVDAVSTWFHLAAVLTLDELVAAADHLVLTPRFADPHDPRPYVLPEELTQRVLASRSRGRRRALEALEFVRDGAESPRETQLRLRLVRAGLPEPACNVAILENDGTLIGYGDLVYRSERVVVEYDGEQHRTDDRQHHRDLERHEALLGAGWLHVRETKRTPHAGPRSTVSRVRDALTTRQQW